MIIDNIPEELKAYRQWVLHKNKIPYCFRGGKASSTNQNTWGAFDEIYWEYENCTNGEDYGGVGFVFTDDDPFVGIDIDKCVDEGGKLSDMAQEIVNKLDSYTEYSPSGKGIHIIIKADLTGVGRKCDSIGLEIYSTSRYFTVTGNRYE